MQREVKTGGYGIGEHTEKSPHQHCDWRLKEVKRLPTMIGGSYTMAFVRACDNNNNNNNNKNNNNNNLLTSQLMKLAFIRHL